MFGSSIQDIRYAFRIFARNPGMAAVIVVSIALGIAANTTVFSIVSATVLGALPVREPERLVSLGQGESLPWPDYLDYRDQTDTFESISARFPLLPVSLGGSEPVRLWGQLVSANYFDVLGLAPAQGRGFLPQEGVEAGGRPMVTVLSDGLWRRRFGRDPAILGRPIILNNRPYTVVGIMPAGFHGEDRGLVTEFWVPLAVTPVIMPDLMKNPILDTSRRDMSWVSLTARLKPGVSREQAQAAVNLVKDRIDAEFRKDDLGKRPLNLSPAGRLWGGVHDYVVGLMAVLMIVVGLVLLIACANVANVLLARASDRRREIGIRLATGATRERLLRQLLTESALLAAGGGVVGVAVAYFATAMLSRFRLPLPFPITFNFLPDARVLGFTAALTMFTGILFGLAPARRATRSDVLSSLKGSGDDFASFRRWGARNVLVSVQVAMSIILLVSAGLFLHSLENASSVETGMQPDRLLLLGFDPKLHAYSPAQTRRFLQELHQRVSGVPGVRSVSFVDVVPLSIASQSSRYGAEGSGDEKQINADYYNVGEDYFQTLGIPVLRGREFDRTIDLGQDSAIISQGMAEELFGDQDPLGRRIANRQGTYEIVGVVGNTKARSLEEEQRSCLYQFLERDPDNSLTLFGLNILVKTQGDAALLTEPVTDQIHELDPNLAVYNAETMRQHINQALLIPRVSAFLLGVFGVVGLTLASIGLYGVISYSVRRRTREIGIRMALGADARAVLAVVLKQGLWLAGIGVIAGLAAAAGLSRLFAGYLFGMQTIDPLTFLAVPLLLLAIALIATLAPALRAAHIEPAEALRIE